LHAAAIPSRGACSRRRVSETAREMVAVYRFAEIAIPIFKFTELFDRRIGAHAILQKEIPP
jgi:histidyl-tRNA synthetase